MDECILGDGGKQRTLVPLSPERRRPLPAGASRTERARSMGWVDRQVIRKPAQALVGGAIEVMCEWMRLLRPDQVGPRGAARQDGSATKHRQRLRAVEEQIGEVLRCVPGSCQGSKC